MEVKAKARYVRIAPKKVRLVIDMVRGMDASAAETQLKFLNKGPAGTVLKLLQSAIANAINNNKLEKSNLYIKKITADDGPTLKRSMPRAFGRATTLRKRSSHIAIVLDEKNPSLAGKEKKEENHDGKEKAAEESVKSLKLEDIKNIPASEKKIDRREKSARGKLAEGVKKKVFNRKAV